MAHKILFYFILFSTLNSSAQKDNTPLNLCDSAVGADGKLSQFLRIIHQDWNINFKDSCMTISFKDSVWVLYYNAANRPANDTSERIFDDTAYLKNNGKKILPVMTFYLEIKWNNRRVSEANKLNKEIYQQGIKLKKKYHLEHLQEWKKWNDSGFLGATPDDEKRIQQYRHEKKILESQRIKMPDYTSSNYSLFVVNENWLNPIPYMVAKMYPKDKVEAIYQTLEDLFKVHSKDEE